MRLAENELARTSAEGAAFRHEPVRMGTVIGPVITRDGHELSAAFSVSVRLVDKDVDVDLFKEQFFAEHKVVTVDLVRQRFVPPLYSSLEEFARQHDAEAALNARATIEQLLFDRANEVGFGCGLQCVRPTELVLHAPTLAQRRLAEQLAARRAEQVDRSVKVLQSLEVPGSIDRLSADDVSTILPLALAERPTHPRYVVAGHVFFQFNSDTGATTAVPIRSADTDVHSSAVSSVDSSVDSSAESTNEPQDRSPDRPARRPIAGAGDKSVRATDERSGTDGGIGPFRSVRRSRLSGCDAVVIGGRRGVVIGHLPTEENHAPTERTEDETGFANWREYCVDSPSDRGINSVEIDTNRKDLVAAHSELGLIRWSLDDGSSNATVPIEGQARLLTRLDERMVFANGAALMAVEGNEVSVIDQLPARIMSIELLEDSLIICCENGHVSRRERGNLKRPVSEFDRAARLQAATVVDCSGLRAIFLAGESGPVECVTLDGRPLLELHSRHRGLRMLRVTGPNVIGVSADRQQLVAWDLRQPNSPLHQINIPARFGHRIADLA